MSAKGHMDVEEHVRSRMSVGVGQVPTRRPRPAVLPTRSLACVMTTVLAAALLAAAPAFAQDGQDPVPSAPAASDPGSTPPPAVPGSPAPAPGEPSPAAPSSGVQVTLASPLQEQTQAHSQAMAQAQLQMAAMQGQYTSLSTSLAGYYASQANLAVGDYVAGSVSVLSAASGVEPLATPEQLASLAASTGSGTSMSELNSMIVGAGAGLDFSRFTSLQDAIDQMRAGSGSIDAAVTSAAALWGQQMLSMSTPTLSVPPTPVLSADLATAMPAEGLAFGMFTNRSINTLVSNFPDVFGAVSKKGFKGVKGAKGVKARSAWKSSVDATAASLEPQLRSLVPGQCGQAFVDGLTGSPASSGCSPCQASGLYAYGQLVASGPSGPGVLNLQPGQATSVTVSQALSPQATVACEAMSGAVTQQAGEAVASALAAVQ